MVRFHLYPSIFSQSSKDFLEMGRVKNFSHFGLQALA